MDLWLKFVGKGAGVKGVGKTGVQRKIAHCLKTRLYVFMVGEIIKQGQISMEIMKREERT